MKDKHWMFLMAAVAGMMFGVLPRRIAEENWLKVVLDLCLMLFCTVKFFAEWPEANR
jgi:hypothetical protein